MKTQEVHELVQLIDYAEMAAQDLGLAGTDEVWFRGQSTCNANWKLRPALFRAPTRTNETLLVNNFMLKAHLRYPRCPPESDRASWLCIMRHYGLPTRLLDWTESLLVALYFAVGHENYNERATVYALSPKRLNESFAEAGGPLLLSSQSVQQEILNPLFEGRQVASKALAVVPPEVDARIMMQQSVFTIHGTEQALEDIPANDHFLIRYVIYKEASQEMRKELRALGVRRSTLFPDLENLAKDIADSTGLFQQDSAKRGSTA